MTRWYCLNANGDMIYLGEHQDFEGASNRADTLDSPAIWIVDESAARDWLTQLKEMLK